MPKVVVQTASAGDAFDLGLPSAAGDSMQTVSVEPLSGPIEMVVVNDASPKFRYYISLVTRQ